MSGQGTVPELPNYRARKDAAGKVSGSIPEQNDFAVVGRAIHGLGLNSRIVIDVVRRRFDLSRSPADQEEKTGRWRPPEQLFDCVVPRYSSGHYHQSSLRQLIKLAASTTETIDHSGGQIVGQFRVRRKKKRRGSRTHQRAPSSTARVPHNELCSR